MQQGNNKIHYWFDEQLIQDELEHCFDITYWQEKQAVIGSACGRGVTWFVQMPQLAGALRHYRRGGLVGKCVKDSYWFTSWQNTRPAKEFALLSYLHQAGFPAPKPIAARAIKQGLIYRADILVEKIPNAQDLVTFLRTAPLNEQEYRAIGQVIRQLHDLGVYHSDLNIHNILLDETPQYWIIDFDKCKKKNGESWKKANLDRLLRSFHKEKQKGILHWQDKDWQALMDGYKTPILSAV